MALTQSVASLADVLVPVSVQAPPGTPYNPTADTVQMAFTLGGATPASGDWQTASWTTNTAITPNQYFAVCLVGPGGTTALALGEYTVWVRVTDNPEVPVLQADTLTIY